MDIEQVGKTDFSHHWNPTETNSGETYGLPQAWGTGVCQRDSDQAQTLKLPFRKDQLKGIRMMILLHSTVSRIMCVNR